MGRLLRQYKAGQMSLRKYDKLMPYVASIVELMQEIEDARIGFDEDGIDESQIDELKCDIYWFENIFTEDEWKIIMMIANDELGYEQSTGESDDI
jgi:hypothetical protein